MKIIFMGTPDFSVMTLESLVNAGHQVAAVVTQPDKPKGRSGKMQYPPVKAKALELNIPVYQPKKVKEPDFFEVIKKINPDVIVVIAFGQILPKIILDYPKYGCINIHASLLPKYRGAAPIQWSVINGEKETGITTMQMDVGLDTGDMIDRVVVPIEEKETGGSLHDKLMRAGSKLILETLEKIENNTAVFTKQSDEDSNYAQMLTKQLGKLDFEQKAVELERLIRGLNPWPSAYTRINGKNLKIWEADVVKGDNTIAPGVVYEVTKDSFLVATADGALQINELQLEGKKRMSVSDFLRGYQLENGTRLGE